MSLFAAAANTASLLMPLSSRLRSPKFTTRRSSLRSTDPSYVDELRNVITTIEHAIQVPIPSPPIPTHSHPIPTPCPPIPTPSPPIVQTRPAHQQIYVRMRLGVSRISNIAAEVPAWEGEPLSRPPIMEAHAGQLGLVPLIGPGQLCSGPTGTGPLGLRQVGLGPFGPGPWARAHYRRGRPGCHGHRYFSEHSVTQIIHIRIVSRRRGLCLATASHK